MKAFVSLHTGEPQSQIDQEVSYAGYRRVQVEYGEGFGEHVIRATFPTIEEDSPDVANYIAVGREEIGQGEIFMRVPLLPHIPLLAQKERRTEKFWTDMGASPGEAAKCVELHGHVTPQVAITNTNVVKLPRRLHPIARRAHDLVFAGLLKTDEIHPKLFEAINDELAAHRVPVLQVTRSGTASMKAKLSEFNLNS